MPFLGAILSFWAAFWAWAYIYISPSPENAARREIGGNTGNGENVSGGTGKRVRRAGYPAQKKTPHGGGVWASGRLSICRVTDADSGGRCKESGYFINMGGVSVFGKSFPYSGKSFHIKCLA